MLFENHNYLNKDISFFVSRELFEYDIESAGFNILKRFNLVNKDTINKIESMDKKQRQIYIGVMMKEDRDMVSKINDGFIEARRLFFHHNNILDSDVLSIKKDAIFTFKRCHNTVFDNIKFIEKNNYTSYYNLNKKELYYNSFLNKLDVRGISDASLDLHANYMMMYFKKLFKIMEISSNKNIISFIKEFAFEYKQKELKSGYYREFNSKSTYRMAQDYVGKFKNVYIRDVGNSDIHLIDISYNYVNYVLPFIPMII